MPVLRWSRLEIRAVAYRCGDPGGGRVCRVSGVAVLPRLPGSRCRAVSGLVPGGFGYFVEVVDVVARADAARCARRALEDALAGDEGVNRNRLDDCALLVSEVVTNAVQHAQISSCPMLRVLWVRTADILRTEVYDPDPAVPSVVKAEDDDEDGRGMWLLDVMADRWATEPLATGGDTLWPGGKVVWFALRDVWNTRPRRANRCF